MPTVPAAKPAKDLDSAKSFTATAKTVPAKGFANTRAMTTSHQRRAQDFVLSQGRSIRATGATAAKTTSAKERKIIEHIRMKARIQTTITAITVTTTAPAGPPVVPGARETKFHSRSLPFGARSNPKSLMNTRYGSDPMDSSSAAEAKSLARVSCRTRYTAAPTSGMAAAPPSIARPMRLGCWLTRPDRTWRIITTTSGVIMTTTHQLVSPSMESHWESSTSDTEKAPVMKAQSQDAMFWRMLAKRDVTAPKALSLACETKPQPGGHHPLRSHSTGMS
jgi:hypothetical protein